MTNDAFRSFALFWRRRPAEGTRTNYPRPTAFRESRGETGRNAKISDHLERGLARNSVELSHGAIAFGQHRPWRCARAKSTDVAGYARRTLVRRRAGRVRPLCVHSSSLAPAPPLWLA